MKEIIKKLEEEKERLRNEFDLKVIAINNKIERIDSAIEILKGSKKVSTTQQREIVTTDKKPKRKRRTKAEMQNIQKRITSQKYPEEVDDFIENNWRKNIDRVLVELIEEKFDRKYTVDQIKARRRQFGWVSDTVGRKKGQKAIVKIESNGKPLKAKKTKQQKYPDELEDFIKEHMETNSNKQLVGLINEKYEIGITLARLNSYMVYKKLRRKEPKPGPPKKYTDEVIDYLRDNVNNFSNKELCEELENQFNLKINPDRLSVLLSNRGIKRNYQTNLDQEIVDFIKQSKTKDAYAVRDMIIEKFEKNISMAKIREIISKRPKLPGESVKEEVKRIEEKRDAFDDDLDELGLYD